MRDQLASQNYLKCICSITLQQQKPLVRIHEISQRLKVSPAAVSDMIKKLIKEKWLVSHGSKGVELTESGFVIGTKMIRHHRLWETFLHKTLGMGYRHIHDEAERLEHASSDTLINQLDAFLEFPKTDPHGNPIPDKTGHIPKLPAQLPLSECNIGQHCQIQRFVALDPDFLSHLAQQGLSIGKTLRIDKRLDFDQSMVCLLGDKSINLSAQSLDLIFVSVLSD
eukprot:COSAG01_NODE_775_length_13698_cov_60.191632_6_plen_224_part_00